MMPRPQFYRDMGMASIIAGVILLGIGKVVKVVR